MDGHYDVVVEVSPGADPSPWIEAGATWCLTDFGQQASAAQVADVIAGGP